MILGRKTEHLTEFSDSSELDKQLNDILSMDKITIEIPVIKNNPEIRLLQNIDEEISKIYKKKIDDLEKIYYNWTMAGWYRLQEGSIRNIYSLNGKAMCYNCCTKFDNKEDVFKINFGYILSNKIIPTFLSKHLTRLFVICNKCENTVAPFPPPKTWQESIILTIYNEYNSKTSILMDTVAKNKTKKYLALTNKKMEEELELMLAENEKLEQNIEKINKSISINDSIMGVRKELLHSIINKEAKELKILENEEEMIRNYINKLESNIIEQKKKLETTLKEMNNMVAENVSKICSIYNGSDISKLSLSLKTVTDTMCKACYSNEADIVLNPCGHVVLCKECYDINGSLCPICRKTVASTTQMFR
jgi:hypothetical protein